MAKEAKITLIITSSVDTRRCWTRIIGRKPKHSDE
jgi:hypothetical protein